MSPSAILRYSLLAAVALWVAGSCHAVVGLEGVDKAEESMPLAQGEACQVATQCAGGVCIDGRCCERVCNAGCETCDGATPGICSALPSEQLDAECATGTPIDVTIYAGLGNQAVARIAYDSVGNRLVSGHFQGTVDLGDGEATAADEAIFVAKYAPAGNLLWKALFQTDLSNAVENQLIGFDGNDDVVVIGTYGQNITLGVQSYAFPESDRNIYAAKLDATTGTVLASTSLASVGGQYAVELYVQPAGAVLLLAGFYDAPWEVGQTMLPSPVNAVDIAFVALTETLSPIPLQAIGGTANELPRGMAVDNAGNAFVVARIDGSVTLESPNQPLTADGRDAVLFKRTAAGDIACSLRIDSVGMNSFDEPFKVRLDSQGNAWVLGRSDAGLDLGNDIVIEHGGGADVWLAKVNSDCLLVTAINISAGSGDETAFDFAIDAQDNLIVTYDLVGSSTDLGGGPLASYGARDAIIAKFAADGTHLWSAVYGDANDQLFGDVVVDPAGRISVTGRFQGTFSIGDYPLSGNETLANDGVFDAFVATFAP